LSVASYNRPRQRISQLATRNSQLATYTTTVPPRLPIYLDHAATTPVDPRVFQAMRPYFCERFGNAASKTHPFGNDAEAAVEHARAQVATLLNVDVDDQLGAREIVFTSGATESNNLALRGVADACRDEGRHVITQVTEHKAIVDPCKRLQREGYDVSWLGVDDVGRVTAGQVAEAIRPDTVLVSVMWANNETGTLQPIHEIGRLCKERGVLFHTDATQAVGKIPIDVYAAGVDLLSFSGHKFYGPKGCGGLFVRRKNPRVRLAPLLEGGGHERGFRSGTLNVPGIVGVGAACELAGREMAEESRRIRDLRDRLEAAIVSAEPATRLNGHPDGRLPHISNLSFVDVEGERLLAALDDVAVSSASACSSGGIESSYVLRSMGVPEPLAQASIRFSLGRFTTADEIDYAVERTLSVLRRLRQTTAGV
jgi:cysteine desulfurase